MVKHKLKRELIDKPLNEIYPYERNPRINDHVVDTLAKSIMANGFNAPIVTDENGVILAGHTRYKAAKKLGLKTAPCVMITGLGENQKKAYRIADNKIAELAKWDFEELNKACEEEIDWGELEAEANTIDWSLLDEEIDMPEEEIEWPEDMTWDVGLLGFNEHEAEGMRMDADVGRMLNMFEGTSPVREREQRREEEREQEQNEGGERDGDEAEDEESDKVTFIAKGVYGDFGEDFWKLAGELYARGIKTETKWEKK